jgi:formylmethanofuran dehydrogenase subunit E
MSEEAPVLYCANHPDTPTGLRCNRCEKPICPKCAVLGPTGYTCKECVRGQQKVFETAQWYDFIIAAVVAGGLALLGSLLVRFIGFFTIFLAPVLAIGIAEAVRFAVGRRRSKRLFQVAAIAAVLGCLPMLLQAILGIFFGGFNLSILWLGLYAVTLGSTIYYRLLGISIR